MSEVNKPYTVQDLLQELSEYPADGIITSATVRVRMGSHRSLFTYRPAPGERKWTK